MSNIYSNWSYGTQFSFDEQVVGTWINGKPVYQKTINFGALPNATMRYVEHGIQNFERLVNLHAELTNDVWPIMDSVGSFVGRLQMWSTTVSVMTQSNWSSFSDFIITLQYTKSTDEAQTLGGGSVANPYSNWASGNNYSLDEKIVGVWTDGSPVYQKTINVGTMVNAATKTVSISLPNFSRCVGFVMMSATEVWPLINNTDDWIGRTQISASSLTIKCAKNWSAYSGCYATIRYIKTA